MILYEFDCNDHGRFDIFLPVDERDNGHCPTCGEPAKRHYSTHHVYVDFTPGFDHGLMVDVRTKAQRETLIREKGLVRYKD